MLEERIKLNISEKFAHLNKREFKRHKGNAVNINRYTNLEIYNLLQWIEATSKLI